ISRTVELKALFTSDRNTVNLPSCGDTEGFVRRRNCSRGGQALEAAKNGLSDWGIKWWAPILEPKNILQVNDLVVIHRFFLDFSAHPSKNPLVRGVNSYCAVPPSERAYAL